MWNAGLNIFPTTPFHIPVILLGGHFDWIACFYLTSCNSCCCFYLQPTLPLWPSAVKKENRQQEMKGNKMLWVLFIDCKRAISNPYMHLPGFYSCSYLLLLLLSLDLAHKGKCSYCSTSMLEILLHMCHWSILLCVHIVLRQKAAAETWQLQFKRSKSSLERRRMALKIKYLILLDPYLWFVIPKFLKLLVS